MYDDNYEYKTLEFKSSRNDIRGEEESLRKDGWLISNYDDGSKNGTQSVTYKRKKIPTIDKSTIEYKYQEIKIPQGSTDEWIMAFIDHEVERLKLEGWELSKYDDGSESGTPKIIFKAPKNHQGSIQGATTNKNDLSIGSIVKIIIILVVGYWIYSSFSKAIESDKKRQEEITNNTYHLRFANTQLSEIREFSVSEIAAIANSYCRSKNIKKDYCDTFNDCFGEMLYTKSDSLKGKEILSFCELDYTQGINKNYSNLPAIMKDFSVFNGSYEPLEILVKNALHDPSSYDHISTRYRFVLYGTKRPYMVVTMRYRAKNLYNAVVTEEVSTKVDTQTKEMFDIKQ